MNVIYSKLLNDYSVDNKLGALVLAHQYLKISSTKPKCRISPEEMTRIYSIAMILLHEKAVMEAAPFIDLYCDWIKLNPKYQQSKEYILILFSKAIVLESAGNGNKYLEILNLYSTIKEIILNQPSLGCFEKPLEIAVCLLHKKYKQWNEYLECLDKLNECSTGDTKIDRFVQKIFV